MHTEIMRFWSKRFNAPIVQESVRYYSITYSDRAPDGNYMDHYLIVAYIPKDKDVLMYPFRGQLLSEAEMLRIIKLKAFI